MGPSRFPDAPGPDDRSEVAAWTALVDGLRKAGERLADDTADLSSWERADAYRALLRGLHNQLGRFEVDRERPELVPFNGWRQKMFMDNPDFRYWVADLRDDGRYLISGNRGACAFMSITVYAGAGVVDAQAAGRLDSDSIQFDDRGDFRVQVGGARPADGDWLELSPGANALWVRQLHSDVANDELGWCAIEPVHPPPTPVPVDPDRFARHLRRLGSTTAFLPPAFAAAAATDAERPNHIRRWSEMAAGAAFTEPGIHYLRGGWQLEPGEALIIEGPVTPARYWNVLLYSRFLNSLDHRHRSVSRTGATATVVDGRYRFVLAAEDPGRGPFDWLDTEGRPFGIVVLRWLQPDQEPELPLTRGVPIHEVGSQW
jgi:hypothetical protein